MFLVILCTENQKIKKISFILSSDRITEIFFVTDKFCKNFNEIVSAHTIAR